MTTQPQDSKNAFLFKVWASVAPTGARGSLNGGQGVLAHHSSPSNSHSTVFTIYSTLDILNAINGPEVGFFTPFAPHFSICHVPQW